MAKRLEEFDLLKGIGILSVVLGHSAISEPFHDMIYSFHMPLFFMVSGFFFYVQPVQQYCKKMFFRLIIPWMFFVAVNLLFFFSLSLITTHNIPDALNFSVGRLAPLDEDCKLLYRSIWFLIALFLTGNLYNLLSNLLGRKAVSVVVLVLYFAGFVLQKVYIPFFVDTSISVLLFYHLGSVARDCYDNAEKTGFFVRYDKQILFGMLLVFVVLTCFAAFYQPEIDFKANIFPLWVPLLSAPIIIALYFMMKALSKRHSMKHVNAFLVECGTYSICILGFHRLFQEVFYIIFGKLSISVPYVQTFLFIVISIPLILLLSKGLEKYAPLLIGVKRQRGKD